MVNRLFSRHSIRLYAGIVVLALMLSGLRAQSNELAATLEVLNPGVEMLRVNTGNWIPINIEAIVGVGDTIRTDETGRARVTFFSDGIDTELLPETTYRIVRFEGDDDGFTLSVEVIAGQTLQRIGRTLDANSNYDVQTPAMSLVARGTQFAIRVEASGRSGMLVSEGAVDARSADAPENEAVPPQFGIRADEDTGLSDVVRASTFAELDAALDGCSVEVPTPDDVSLNVRLSPDLDAPRVGTVLPAEIDIFIGITESGDWYRIPYRGGFGWVLSSSATVDSDCAGLRVFPDNHGLEDSTLYESLGDDIPPLPTPEPMPEPTEELTPEATPES